MEKKENRVRESRSQFPWRKIVIHILARIVQPYQRVLYSQNTKQLYSQAKTVCHLKSDRNYIWVGMTVFALSMTTKAAWVGTG